MTERGQDEYFMRRAIELAREGERDPGGSPIGCVIVMDGKIVAEGYNEQDKHHDPTAHAEVVTLRRAGAAFGDWEMRGATLYSTLQPCGMCTLASIWAKISRIVYGAERHQVHKLYFEDRHLDTVDFVRDAFRNDIVLEGGVLGDLCASLYYGPQDNPPPEDQVNL